MLRGSAIRRTGISVITCLLAAALLLQPGLVYADVTTLSPNAAGDSTQLTASPAGNNYLRVQTNDGDTSYVVSNNTNTYLIDLYNLADVALSGTVNSVIVTMVARVTNTGQASAYTVIKTNGTQYNGTAQTLTTTYTAYATTYTVNPNTGLAWTWTEVNNLQAGVALRRAGNNRLTRCTQVYVTVNFTPPVVVAPTVTTDNATSVEETTATLNGTLNSDGGEACQYRFEYDTDSGEPYSFSTSWTGSITSGQSFSANITGLDKGTKYYFVAEVKNSAGTVIGSELTLLTKPDAPVSGSFTATTFSSTQIDLSWTKGYGANRTMVRGKEGSYPTDVTDGKEVYFNTGTSVTDAGLSPATTYYYRAWSEVTGSQQWSDSYVETSATTSAGPAPPPITVGGTIYPVNKVYVLSPWLTIVGMLV